MPTISLSARALLLRGVKTSGQILENGISEIYNRSPDGTVYLRTEVPDGEIGLWQKSRGSNAPLENFLVQKGWVAYIELCNGQIVPMIRTSLTSFTGVPKYPYTLFVGPGTILHSIKLGADTSDPPKNAENPETTAMLESMINQDFENKLKSMYEDIVRIDHGIYV